MKIENISSRLLHINAISNPIDYKWSDDVLGKFTNTTDKHPRLDNVLCKVSYKASIGLGASLLELITCRLSGSSELTNEMIKDVKYKIDAIWMATIDPLYAYQLYHDLDNEPFEGVVYGALWATLYAIDTLSYRFNEKSYYIHEPLVGLALLAEYITPEKKLFREWFTNTLKNASEIYPCSYDYDRVDYDELNGEYDCSHEPPVFREFFFGSESSYDEEIAKQKTRDFMQSVKNKGNPYLRSSEEMKELGFNGTPYTI